MSKSRGKKTKKDGKKPVVCIKTFGCQMNMYDTEVAEGILNKQGYEIIPEEETAKGDYVPEAEVYLMNTCSVREHAEDRVFGRLGQLAKLKEKKPETIVGLLGCMVEEHREKLFRRFPQLDLMVGTRNIKELPTLIDKVQRTRKQVSQIKQDGISIEYTDQIQRKGKHHAWLPIMTGCNKVCTFCIVPITRGSEVSMPAGDVYRETVRLVQDGVKWITLLGQNVNSYNGSDAVGADPRVRPKETGQAQGPAPTRVTFPMLLELLCQIEGLERISFTTSHPHDATEELYQVIAKNPKISRRFHLPLQSGSDRILKRMKRLHTFAEYKAKIDRMREVIPDVIVTTDIIAGFSGETEEDHEATLRALREIRYDGAYIYKYSVRPGTPAANLPDDVPLPLKKQRNAELLALQKQIEIEEKEKMIGKTLEVFIENENSYRPGQLKGRTPDEKIIAFEGEPGLVGSFQRVKITHLHNDTFLGESV